MIQDDSEKRRAIEEAMDWLLRLKADPDCPQAARDVEDWLARAETNRSAWRDALKAWDALGEIRPRHADLWPARPVVPLPRRSRRPLAAGIALALAAALLVVLAAPALMIWLKADFRTGTGESRMVTLADGSAVNLSADSAIDVELTPEGRHVRLLAGQAFFDVAHDGKRPFTVEAGNARVVVLGTAFDVALDDTATTVQLARGVVGISGEGDSQAVAEMAPGDMATWRRSMARPARSATRPFHWRRSVPGGAACSSSMTSPWTASLHACSVTIPPGSACRTARSAASA
ncbi:FecR domain-containing protein [Shinella sp. DD12]|uniref:FecR domain-containing protein n=1 Tax=Shinella sp. DD12 TaxID=1410620 RepID=UPI00068A8917|nr:FecR domain-containing protein [Shinella sp. DD12]